MARVRTSVAAWVFSPLTCGIIFDTIRFGRGGSGDMKRFKSVDWKEEITREGPQECAECFLGGF